MEVINVKNDSTGNKLYACCPECKNVGKTPDTKFHLMIIPGKFAFCFRCSYKISYKRLTERYKFSKQNLSIRASTSDKDCFDYYDFLEANTSTLSDINSGVYQSFYEECAVNYLHKRNFDNNDLIFKFGIRLGINKMQGRVVFIDNINKYYMGRAFIKSVDPKTMNPPGVVTKPMMFLDTSIPYRTLYLVEGVFDAMPMAKARKSYACILGKSMSTGQMLMLRDTKVKNVIIALDPDAFKDAMELANEISAVKPLINIGVVTYKNPSEDKDPSDYDVKFWDSTDVLWTRVINEEAYNKFINEEKKAERNV